MPFKFEKLEIWNLSMDLAEEIYGLTKKFPKDERFNLTSQFIRAADSVSLNISEGSIGQTDPEQSRFIGYAVRSIAECVTCLHKARRRKYISQEEFAIYYEKEEILMGKTINFRKSIKKGTSLIKIPKMILMFFP